MAELAAISEHRHGASECTGGTREAVESREHREPQAVTRELIDQWSALGRRRDARVQRAARGARRSSHGLPPVASWHAVANASAGSCQASRDQHARGRRTEHRGPAYGSPPEPRAGDRLAESVSGSTGLVAPSRATGKPVDAPREIDEPAKRRRIAPVQIVCDQQRQAVPRRSRRAASTGRTITAAASASPSRPSPRTAEAGPPHRTASGAWLAAGAARITGSNSSRTSPKLSSRSTSPPRPRKTRNSDRQLRSRHPGAPSCRSRAGPCSSNAPPSPRRRSSAAMRPPRPARPRAATRALPTTRMVRDAAGERPCHAGRRGQAERRCHPAGQLFICASRI